MFDSDAVRRLAPGTAFALDGKAALGAPLVHGVEARTPEQVDGVGDGRKNGNQNAPHNARATPGVRNLP